MGRQQFDDDIEIIDWGEDEEEEVTVDSAGISDGNGHKKNKGNDKEKEETFNLKKEIISFVKIVIFAVFTAFIIDHVLIVNAEVPSGSMENTIMTHSRMIGWRLSYKFSNEPKRGDVIIFKYPDDPSKNYVKRVIALPGEKIKVEEGVVYINGEQLEESYVVFKDRNDNIVERDDSGDFDEVEVPEGCYFVMGDNRNNSWDSRYWSTTNFVDEGSILGKAIFCYWHNGPEFDVLE